MHLVFRFAPESAPQTALKLKVEINTREHEVLFGYRRHPFEVASDWYSARTEIVSFEPEELFGTKLRPLLQRRKNRDLFDLHHGLTQLGLDRDKVVTCLNHYLALEDHPISRAEAEERMLKKLTRSLTEDIEPLLPVVCASTKPWRSMRSTTCGQPSLRGFAETRGGSPPMWSRSFEPSTQGS